jgi:hypothetical protein
MAPHFSVLTAASVFIGAAAPSAFAQGCIPQSGSQNICASASSATLSNVVGQVFLSRGGRLVVAKAGTVLAAGDRVISRQGSADVSFDRACMAPVNANSMMTLVQSGPQLCAQPRTTAPVATTQAPAELPGSSPVTGGSAPLGGGAIVGASSMPYMIAGGILAGGVGVFAAGQKNRRLSP